MRNILVYAIITTVCLGSKLDYFQQHVAYDIEVVLDDSAHALDHEIVSGIFRIGSSLTESGDGAIDETGIIVFEVVVAEAEFGQRTDPDILYHHIGALEQSAED